MNDGVPRESLDPTASSSVTVRVEVASSQGPRLLLRLSN